VSFDPNPTWVIFIFLFYNIVFVLVVILFKKILYAGLLIGFNFVAGLGLFFVSLRPVLVWWVLCFSS
jgi:hypothetical protein